MAGLTKLGKYGCIGLAALVTTLPVKTNAQDRTSSQIEILCSTPADCFGEGKALYDKGDYARAGIFFEKACSLATDSFSRAILFYNIGVIYELGRSPDTAITYFNLYLGSNPEILAIQARNRNKDFTPPGREEIAMRIEDLILYSKALRTYREAEFYERSGQYQLAIGHYRNYLKSLGAKHWDIEEVEKRIEKLNRLLEGPENPPTDTIVPDDENDLPEVPDDNNPPRSSFLTRHKLSLATGAFGGASGLVGLLFNGLASSKFDSLRSSCGEEGCSEDEINGVKGLARVRDISYAIGIGAAVIGAGIFLVENLRGKKESEVSFDTNGIEVKF